MFLSHYTATTLRQLCTTVSDRLSTAVLARCRQLCLVKKETTRGYREGSRKMVIRRSAFEYSRQKTRGSHDLNCALSPPCIPSLISQVVISLLHLQDSVKMCLTRIVLRLLDFH